MGKKVYEKIKIHNKALLKASSKRDKKNFNNIKEIWKNIIIKDGEISGNQSIEKDKYTWQESKNQKIVNLNLNERNKTFSWLGKGFLCLFQSHSFFIRIRNIPLCWKKIKLYMI